MSRRLRVLYTFPHQIGDTGIGYTALQQVQGLVDANVSVHLFSTRQSSHPIDVSHRETLAYMRAFIPQRAVGLDRARALHDRIVAGHLSRNRHSYDLVHAWPSGSLRTLEVARQLGIPTALERPSAHTRFMYSVEEEERSRLGLPPHKSFYASFNQKRLAREESEFREASALLCPSEFVVKTFLQAGFPSKRLIRHQYGFDPHRFQPDGQNQRENLYIYVGGLYPLKGLHYALKAWNDSEASQDSQFVIYGKGDPYYTKYVLNSIRSDRVQFRGFVQNIANEMRRARAIIHPSRAEGSALVIYEARASGCVPLMSSASGAEGKHGEDSLIHAPGDVQALTNHIRIARSDDQYVKLRSKSLALSHSQTWERATERLIRAYREIQALSI